MKKPWLAGLLAFFFNGLGHIYVGNLRRGLCFFFGTYVIFLIAGVFRSFLLSLIPLLFFTAGYFIYRLIEIFDAVRIARKYPKHDLKYQKNWFYVVFAITCSVILVIYPLGNVVGIRSFRISAGSNLPTLFVGERIISQLISYKTEMPKRGEMIVFIYPKNPKLTYVKRVIGLPGDKVSVVNQEVILNGKTVNLVSTDFKLDRFADPFRDLSSAKIFKETLPGYEHEYFVTQDTSARHSKSVNVIFNEVIVPPDHVFVLGDRRDHSSDSRVWGFVSRDKIIGKVKFVFFSFESKNNRIRWDRIGKNIY